MATTLILCRADGADGSAVFTNEVSGGVAPTSVGGALQTHAQAYAGVGSADFHAQGGGIIWPTLTLTAPWTVESFHYSDGLTSYVFGQGRGETENGWFVERSASDTLLKSVTVGSITPVVSNADDLLGSPAFHHVAVSAVVAGGTATLYLAVDGAIVGTATGLPLSYTGPLAWGDRANDTGGSVYDDSGGKADAWGDLFRVTSGVAKYTAAYTIPTDLAPEATVGSGGLTSGQSVVSASGRASVITTATPSVGKSTTSAVGTFNGAVLATGLAAGTSTVGGMGQGQGISFYGDEEDDEFAILQWSWQMAIQENEEGIQPVPDPGVTIAIPAAGIATVSATTSLVRTGTAVPAAGTSTVSAAGSVGSIAIPAAGLSIVSAISGQTQTATGQVSAGLSVVSAQGGKTGTVEARAIPADGSSVVKGRGVGGLAVGGLETTARKTSITTDIARTGTPKRLPAQKGDWVEQLRPGIAQLRQEREFARMEATRRELPQFHDDPAARALYNLQVLQGEARVLDAQRAEQARVQAEKAAQEEAARVAELRMRQQQAVIALLLAEA